MARATYVLMDGKLVQKLSDGEYTAEYLKALEKQGKRLSKSSNIWSDTLGSNVNGLLNPADGKMYDSKSEFNKAVIRSGCRVVGNDYNDKQYKRPEVRGDFNVRADMQRAVNKVMRGN